MKKGGSDDIEMNRDLMTEASNTQNRLKQGKTQS